MFGLGLGLKSGLGFGIRARLKREGGEARRGVPLERGAALRAYDRLAAPLLNAVERQRGGAHGGGVRCGGEPPWRVLPAFWPLGSRHVDHPGRTPGPPGGRPRRADCTHWRECSAAMGYLNELLLDALARMPQPLAHAHGAVHSPQTAVGKIPHRIRSNTVFCE